jgi:hypothetical protein
MRRLVCLISAICCMGVISFATENLMDDFENAGVYLTSTQPSESLSVANSTERSQGAKSLEVTYNHVSSAAWYNTAMFDKTLSTPLDISQLEYLSYDLNVPAAKTAFLLVIYFFDEKDYATRIVNYNAFNSATGGFKTFRHKLSDMQKTRWVALGRTANMKKITKISYQIQRAADPGNGTFTFKIDNLKFVSDAGLIQEVLLEGFESYADDAALQAKWLTAFNGSNRTLVTSGAYEGTKCINLNANIVGNWYNYGAQYSFTTPQDFSATRYFKMAVFGDAQLADYNAIAHLYLEDSSANRILAYGWLWPEEAEWIQFFFPFDAEGIEHWTAENTLEWGGSSLWREDKWDTGGWSVDADLTKIQKILITLETGAAAGGTVTYPLNNVNIKFDNIIAGYETNEPPTTTPTPTPEGGTAATLWAIYE